MFGGTMGIIFTEAKLGVQRGVLAFFGLLCSNLQSLKSSGEKVSTSGIGETSYENVIFRRCDVTRLSADLHHALSSAKLGT